MYLSAPHMIDFNSSSLLVKAPRSKIGIYLFSGNKEMNASYGSFVWQEALLKQMGQIQVIAFFVTFL